MNHKSIVIAAAGTSGHIRPAWVLGLQAQKNGVDVAWVGSVRDAWVPKEPWKRLELEMRGVRNRGFIAWLCLPWVLLKAVLKIYRFLADVQPDAVVLMGGYVTVPTALVAKFMGIPYTVFEQNTVVCLSNRCVLPWAKSAFTGMPLVKPDARVHYIGNPLPEHWVKKDNVIIKERISVLVMGGSLGASSLNMRVPELLKKWRDNIVVVHIAGEKQLEYVKDRYDKLQIKAECYGYQESLYDLLSSSDIAITRSGAMSMTECLSLSLPCIMIPFPHASDDHQLHNARWFESLGGGVCVQEDKDFDANMLRCLTYMLQPGVLLSMRTKLDMAQKIFDKDLFWQSC